MAKLKMTARDWELEAEGWKETARAWRLRAMKNASAWKAKALKFRDELHEIEAERDELLEEIEPLREHAKIAVTPAELTDLRRKTKDAETAQNVAVREKKFVESQMKDANARMLKAEQTAETFRREAQRAREDLGKEREKLTRELVQPARASLRVIATRCGVTPEWLKGAEYKPRTDDEILAEIDRRILALQGAS